MLNKQKPIYMRDLLKCLDTHNIAYTYDADVHMPITATAPLHRAKAGHMGWFASADYIKTASTTGASVVITTEKLRSHVSDTAAVVCTDNPRLAYAKIKSLLYPRPQANGNIAKTAVIADDAILGDHVQLDDFVTIHSGAVLHSGVWVGAYTVIGENVCIGTQTQIGTHCHIAHAKIGTECVVHPHVTLGTDGFGFVLDFTQGHHSIPHTGGVIIGNHVHIGAGVCMDKGVESHTIVGDFTRIDNLVHIAHNVVIGKRCVIPAQVGIAGSVVIGDGVMFSGQAGVADGVHIGDGAIVLMRAVVAKDIPKNQVVSGVPARLHKDNLRREAKLNKLIRTHEGVKV